MKNHITHLLRFFEFCLCLCFFPTGFRIIRLCSIEGMHAISEKFFLFIAAQRISADGDILEIGSYKGSSSLLLASGNARAQKSGKVWLVEPAVQPDKNSFLDMFRSYKLIEDIILLEKKSQDLARDDITTAMRLVFIDGDHTYESVSTDIVLAKRYLAPGGIIAFHNISYDGVRRAVDELCAADKTFKVLGRLADTLYASKGNSPDRALFRRFNMLNLFRSALARIVRPQG